MPSPAEIAVRVVAKLIEIGEDRTAVMAALTPVVQQVTAELDPDGTRDSTPMWWRDLPGWVRLDAFDRLRRGHDELLVIEVRAQTIRVDMAGMLALTPVGRPGRPLGLGPWDAYRQLQTIAAVSATHLTDMTRASRMICPRLTPDLAGQLRAQLRALDSHQRRAKIERDRLKRLEKPEAEPALAS